MIPSGRPKDKPVDPFRYAKKPDTIDDRLPMFVLSKKSNELMSSSGLEEENYPLSVKDYLNY